MDLMTTNSGAIAEGNARMQSVRDYNNRVQTHNNGIAGQMKTLESGQTTASVLQQTKDATAGIWSAGNIPNKIQGYKDFRNGVKPNPSTPPELSETEVGSSNLFDEAGETALGDSHPGLFSKGLKAVSISDEALGTIGKGAGIIGSSAIGGYDIYKDFQGGKGFHLAGDNWASETSNALQIGGAIADIGGLIPGLGAPLALFGGILDLAGAGLGEVGELIDSSKTKAADKTLAASQVETTQAVVSGDTTDTARVS